MVPIGWNITQTIKCVFSDLSLNFVIKIIILKNAVFGPVDNFYQASKQKIKAGCFLKI